MPPTLDRRAFLGLAAGVVVLGACGSGGSDASGNLVLIPNDWDFLAGSDYRLAVLIGSNADGSPVAINSPLTLRVGRQGQPLGAPIPMVVHSAGPEPNYALTTYRFAEPGTYELEAHFEGHTTSTPIQVILPSQSATPVIGDKMISIATPTTKNHLGVNPYCTQQPPCPFHTTSLDAALAAKRPVALQFATPALCTSRFCGPVLLNLQAVHAPWAQQVTFIHCEIYTDLTGATTTKPVQRWGLQHEPMLYLGDAKGVIVDRIDNLYDTVEVRDALTRAYGAA